MDGSASRDQTGTGGPGNDGGLRGRVALVTGVSRSASIGWAIAQRLVADGASVLAAGWTPHDEEMPWGVDPIDRSVESDQLAFVEANLSLASAPASLVDATVERYGGVDIIVAAHARSSSDDLFAASVTDLDECWRVNARASLLLVRALAEAHPKVTDSVPGTESVTFDRGSGRAVLFTSGQHLEPMPGEVAYAVSKGAIHQMTATLADAVADRGITVNCVNPGPVDTGWAPASVRAQVAEAFPAGRWGRPSDTANLVAWLVSDEAAWVTGQVINSEGGFRR